MKVTANCASKQYSLLLLTLRLKVPSGGRVVGEAVVVFAVVLCGVEVDPVVGLAVVLLPVVGFGVVVGLAVVVLPLVGFGVVVGVAVVVPLLAL